MLYLIVLIGCPVLFALGAMSDLVSYRIPNWISLGLVALFAVAAMVAPMGWTTVAGHLAVFAVALACGMALFAFNIIGGGDAKLMAAGALWAGPLGILPYCVFFAIAGGFLVVALVVLRHTPLPAGVSRVAFINRLMEPRGPIPYGVALGIGAMIVLPKTALFLQALTT